MAERRALSDGRKLGVAVCKALGLDPDITEGINITLSASGPALVVVSQRVPDDAQEKILHIFELAEWKEAPGFP